MPVFKVWKKFPFPTPLLQQYFMCHCVWQKAMPYKLVKITPEQKYRWNWQIMDHINFVIFKWKFEHTFTSVQEQHSDHLLIKFENSNQVTDFIGKILFIEKTSTEVAGGIENTVTIEFDKLNLKDPMLNTLKFAFIDIMKRDYKQFLNNVFLLLQQKEERLQILGDCYWTDYSVIPF